MSIKRSIELDKALGSIKKKKIMGGWVEAPWDPRVKEKAREHPQNSRWAPRSMLPSTVPTNHTPTIQT